MILKLSDFVLGCFLFVLCCKSSAWKFYKNDKYIYPTLHWFNQKLDHFNPTIDKTFQQRYFVSDQYWSQGKGPIFFYTGNEGDVEAFINNTGFIWDIAPTFQAMVVFAEHRYYGQSLPYGDIHPSVNTTFEYGQLTAEQALADFAELIQNMKATRQANDVPVIAFGGSYGGMLAAWLRMKYGNVVDGAIAASAPVNLFPGYIACYKYNEVVTNDFLSTPHGQQCVSNVRHTWPIIMSMAGQSGGLKKLSEIFHTCHTIKSSNELIDWIKGCWSNLAMVDYPYPANFLNPLPSWPINVTCEQLSSPLEGVKLLHAIYRAMNIYNNYTGAVTCFDTQTTSTGAISTSVWNYQSCTEMVMPFCANGKSDMFPPHQWVYDDFVKDCKDSYGVTPRPDWVELNFGGDNLKSASNIVFSNGDLDPWHVGGVLNDVSDSVVAIKMWGAAHHLDLRHHNPSDPASVVEGRKQEAIYISKWIVEKSIKKQGVTFH